MHRIALASARKSDAPGACASPAAIHSIKIEMRIIIK
jgi:hypothetical protein